MRLIQETAQVPAAYLERDGPVNQVEVEVLEAKVGERLLHGGPGMRGERVLRAGSTSMRPLERELVPACRASSSASERQQLT